jgi:hypothetical protein
MPEPNEGFVGCSACGRIVRADDVNTRGKCVLCANGGRGAATGEEEPVSDPATVDGVVGPEDHGDEPQA